MIEGEINMKPPHAEPTSKPAGMCLCGRELEERTVPGKGTGYFPLGLKTLFYVRTLVRTDGIVG